MAHDIVPNDTLPLLGILVIDIILVCLELRNLLVGNIQPKLFLCLRKRNPELSPGTELFFLGKQVLHLPACIALGKRAYVAVISTHIGLLTPLLVVASANILCRRLNRVAAGKAPIADRQSSCQLCQPVD